MGRIRTVKPELFRHEGLLELEQETKLPIRVAFIGLFTVADKEGRFKWRPNVIKLDVLPFDDVDFSRVLDALATRGFIEKYASGNEFFGHILKFKEHQHINHREQDSVLPSPYNETSSTRELRVVDASGEKQGHARGERERERNIYTKPLPLKKGKGESSKKQQPNPIDEVLADLPQGINREQFLDWVQWRQKEKRKPVTPKAAKLAIKKLMPYSHEEQTRIIEHSISNDWQAIGIPFDLRQNNRNQAPSQDEIFRGAK